MWQLPDLIGIDDFEDAFKYVRKRSFMFPASDEEES